VGATVSAHQSYAFADGNGGHACVFSAGAPLVGDFDVLFANSDTVVATPSGFTLETSFVGDQGAYTFARLAVGGESDTVTVTTSGNFNCVVSWIRVHNATGVDSPNGIAEAHADSSTGSSTPAVSTGTLATTVDLVLAAGMLHSVTSPNTPVWSAGYTNLESPGIGAGGSAAFQFAAVKVPAGTAAESPSVSWTNAASDRYIQVIAFTATSSFTGTATDAVTLSDAATRTVTQTRGVTDSTTLSDVATRAAALARAGTDAVTLSDAVTSRVVLPRGATDVTTLSDVVAASVILARGISDAVTFADVATRAFTQARAVTGSITFTDVATGTSGARTLTLIFGQPQFLWSFGTPRTSSGITAGGGPVILSILATDYVQVPAAAYVDGAPVNPTSDLIEMAFTTVGARPGSGDWHTGSWDTAPGGTYLAQCLVGPGTGGVVLGLGIYSWWVRVTDNPTIPVAEVGQLQIV